MNYTPEQIEEFANKLQQLPEITKNKLSTKKEAIGKLKGEILLLRKKGYSVENIAESLRGIGLDITSQTLKTYLQRTKSVTKKKAQSKATVDTPPLAPSTKTTTNAAYTNTAAFEVKEDTIDI